MMDTTYRSSWSRFIISEDIAQGARTKEVGVEADGCEDEGDKKGGAQTRERRVRCGLSRSKEQRK